MILSFLAEPLRRAVEAACQLGGGSVTQNGNTIKIQGNSDLLRSLFALGPALHRQAKEAGLSVELVDLDADLRTAGVFGENGAPFGGTS